MEQPSKKELCRKLDEKLFELFETLGNILLYQRELESVLSDGYFLMSKARYSMGVQSISQLQYNVSDLTLAKVHLAFSSEEFSVWSYNRISSIDQTDSLGLRRRNAPSDGNKATISDNIDAVSAVKDPIKWFGVLVPQALRQCQDKFSRAIEICIHIANAKVRFTQLQTAYRSLYKEKLSLFAPESGSLSQFKINTESKTDEVEQDNVVTSDVLLETDNQNYSSNITVSEREQ